MKLRTKVALTAGAGILLAILVSGGLIFQVCWTRLMSQATAAATQESQEVFRDFEAYGGQFRNFSASVGEYCLKARHDSYTVLLEDGKVRYNQTVLSPAMLKDIYEACMDGASAHIPLFYEGRRLLAFCYFGEGGLSLIHFCDVTGTYLELYTLAGYMALISLTIAAGAILLLFLLLRRSLRPLRALSEGARSVAAGAYGRRVPDSGRDEVAELGRDFNTMARAVEEHIQEVEAAEEKKTLFMASLTHELKTPLTAISGYAQTLRMAKLEEADRELALDYIYRESKRLDRLSKKMLRLLELDRDAALTLEPTPIAELLEGARRACLPAAEAKGVELLAEWSAGTLNADRDLMTEAVINLVDNAVKASEAGTAVRLCEWEGGILVEDQGGGVPEEDLGRLMEPFYMVDKSRSRKSGGAGLGLALVGVIVRRHGLRVEIDSEVGKGTRVRIF